MKFTVDASLFAQALQAVKNAAPSSDNQRALALLTASKDGGVALTANDQNLQSSWTLDAEVGADGSACIDVKDLADVAKHLPKKGDVLVQMADGQIDLITERSQFRFAVLDADQFVPWSNGDAGTTQAVPADAFARLIGGALHAVSQDDAMPQLAGVLLTNHGGQTPLRAVATDGHRLACMETDKISLDLPADGVVLPSRTVREILRLCQGIGMIGVAIDARVIEVDGGPEVLRSKLIDARYPDYQVILRGAYQHELEIERKLLVEAAGRVGAILKKSPILRVIVDTNGLHLRADREQASALETVQAMDLPSESGVELGLNARYLQDALKAMTSPTVRIQYAGPTHPVRLSGANDPGFDQIMMPARL